MQVPEIFPSLLFRTFGMRLGEQRLGLIRLGLVNLRAAAVIVQQSRVGAPNLDGNVTRLYTRLPKQEVVLFIRWNCCCRDWRHVIGMVLVWW